MRVTENFRKIQDLLAQACREASRDERSVRLLAVSKKKPPEQVLQAAALGQRDFGENFVQEGLAKIEATAREELNWHFIGHLQSNKTRAVAEHFHWVHTVDRAKIAERLSQQRPHDAADLNICIQVNVDGDPAKSGVPLSEAPRLADEIADLPRLKLRGLMCLPTARDAFDEQRLPFAKLRECLQTLQSKGHDMDTLSMGMTADYRAAIHEGATIVRIGTALFGKRD
ncbi:MAG: YggS family pyridoxal phosphate-dependent enzyme [Pseudomonadota bacterium]